MAGIGLAVAAIVVATLRPSGSDLAAGWTFYLASGDQAVAEFLQNIILFIPLGLALALGRARTAPWRLMAAGALLSFAIEFAHQWIPGRDPSLGDIVANTVGTAVGVVVTRTAPLWLAPPPPPSRAAWLSLGCAGRAGSRRAAADADRGDSGCGGGDGRRVARPTLLPILLCPLPDRLRQLTFRAPVVGHGAHQTHHLGLGRLELFAVQPQKNVHREKRDSLVAVSVRVIRREAIPVRRRQRRQVGCVVVRPFVAGTCQGRLEGVLIPYPRSASVLLELIGVNRVENGALEPPRLGHAPLFGELA